MKDFENLSADEKINVIDREIEEIRNREVVHYAWMKDRLESINRRQMRMEAYMIGMVVAFLVILILTLFTS